MEDEKKAELKVKKKSFLEDFQYWKEIAFFLIGVLVGSMF